MKLPALILCLSFALAVPARAGSLYITSGDTVVSFDVSLGTASAIAASRQTVLSGTSYLQNAQGIVFDSSANLYVANLGGLGSDGWVTKFNPDGSFHSMITEAMKSPSALAVTSSNSLWVLNIGPQNPIVQYTPTGTVWGAITNLPNNPASLAVNSDDELYVGFQNDSGDRIKIFNGVSQVGGIGAPANWVGGLAFDSTGSLYATNFLANQIEVFNSSNQHTATIGDGSTLNSPSSMAFDPSGNLYVMNSGTGSSSVIAKFDSSGNYQFSWNVGNANSLTYGPILVPEPSTYAMALVGIGVGGWRMWRRRRSWVQRPAAPRRAC
jgi:sugar lactone lactonase YvrE